MTELSSNVSGSWGNSGKNKARRLLYPPNAYSMPWIRTDKIYTLIDHVLLLLLPTSYMST